MSQWSGNGGGPARGRRTSGMDGSSDVDDAASFAVGVSATAEGLAWLSPSDDSRPGRGAVVPGGTLNMLGAAAACASAWMVGAIESAAPIGAAAGGGASLHVVVGSGCCMPSGSTVGFLEAVWTMVASLGSTWTPETEHFSPASPCSAALIAPAQNPAAFPTKLMTATASFDEFARLLAAFGFYDASRAIYLGVLWGSGDNGGTAVTHLIYSARPAPSTSIALAPDHSRLTHPLDIWTSRPAALTCPPPAPFSSSVSSHSSMASPAIGAMYASPLARAEKSSRRISGVMVGCGCARSTCLIVSFCSAVTSAL